MRKGGEAVEGTGATAGNTDRAYSCQFSRSVTTGRGTATDSNPAVRTCPVISQQSPRSELAVVTRGASAGARRGQQACASAPRAALKQLARQGPNTPVT